MTVDGEVFVFPLECPERISENGATACKSLRICIAQKVALDPTRSCAGPGTNCYVYRPFRRHQPAVCLPFMRDLVQILQTNPCQNCPPAGRIQGRQLSLSALS